MTSPADYNWPFALEREFTGQAPEPVERAADTSCFLSIRFPYESRLEVGGTLQDGVVEIAENGAKIAVTKLPQIASEITPPEHFHLTLLVADQCTDEQLAMFLANLSPTLPFSIEVTGLKLIQSPESQVLVWSIDPGPALARLQSELYNSVSDQDMQVSEFSKPKDWIPHITVAYDLNNMLHPDDLPEVSPFRLMVNSFTIGRNYDDFFEVHLPRGVGDRQFVEQHHASAEPPVIEVEDEGPATVVSRTGLETEITVKDLAKLVHGGQIMTGVLRRAVGLEGNRFVVQRVDGVVPGGAGPTSSGGGRGTGGSKQDGSKVGMKKKETGFNPDGRKRQFGMDHHQPVTIDIEPNLKELLEAFPEWDGGAEYIVEHILLDSGTSESGREGEAYDEKISPQVVQWFDNPDATDRPLTIVQMSEMSDTEIQVALDGAAATEEGNSDTEPKKNQPKADARGRLRSYMFGRDGEEIVAVAMATLVDDEDYRIGILEGGALDALDLNTQEQVVPHFQPDNYEEENFETGFIYIDWMAVKITDKGYGSQMLGEIFRQAAADSRGVFLEANKSSGEFFTRFRANVTDDATIFWTADEVEEWAETAEEESLAITGDEKEEEVEEKSLVKREDLSEVLFGADDPKVRPFNNEEDHEPIGGDYTIGNALWIEKPRPWKRQFAEQIEDATFMSDEDAAVLEARQPEDQRAPDERETMLQGVQRALENLVSKVFARRHGRHEAQEGVEGQRGGSAPGFTHVGAESQELGEQLGQGNFDEEMARDAAEGPVRPGDGSGNTTVSSLNWAPDTAADALRIESGNMNSVELEGLVDIAWDEFSEEEQQEFLDQVEDIAMREEQGDTTELEGVIGRLPSLNASRDLNDPDRLRKALMVAYELGEGDPYDEGQRERILENLTYNDLFAEQRNKFLETFAEGTDLSHGEIEAFFIEPTSEESAEGDLASTNQPEDQTGKNPPGESEEARREEFARLSKVLTRVLGERMEVDVNPSDGDTFAEIKDTMGDWQEGADDIVQGFLDDVEGQTNILGIEGGETSTEDTRPIDYDALSDMEHEYYDALAADPVDTLTSDYDAWVDGYYEVNNIESWDDLEAALMEDFDLTEQQIRGMGSQELHNLVGDQAAIATLEENDIIEEGEYEHLTDVRLPSGGDAGGDYGDSLRSPGQQDRPPTQTSEIFNSVAWDFSIETLRENTTTAELEQHFGGLPREGDATGEPAETVIEGGFDVLFRDNQHAFVGREDGEIVAVLSATVETNHHKVNRANLESMVANGTSAQLGLSDEETMAMEGQSFVTLNYLAAKRGGAGHGVEMILRGLKLAADNDAGIIGNSVVSASSFYDRLGARWFDPRGPEKGGPALFTPEDVKSLVGWLEESGMDIDNVAGGELDAGVGEILANESMVVRFSPDEVAEAFQDDPAAHFTRFTRKSSEKAALASNDEWVDRLDAARPMKDVLQKRHGKHEGQQGRPPEKGGSQEGFTHVGADSSGEGGSSKKGGGGKKDSGGDGARTRGEQLASYEGADAGAGGEWSFTGDQLEASSGSFNAIVRPSRDSGGFHVQIRDADDSLYTSETHETLMEAANAARRELDDLGGSEKTGEDQMAEFGEALPLPGQDFDYDLDASNNWLRENFEEGMKHLTSQEVASIAEYKMNAHGDINRFLRNEETVGDALDDDAVQGYVDVLDDVMQRTEVPEPVVAYRGMDLEDLGQLGRNFDDLEGEVFTFDGYTSTSLDKQMAVNFAGTREPGLDDTKDAEPPVLVRIQVPEGTKAIWTEDTQVNEMGVLGGFEEAELLLDRGLQFRVISTGREDSKRGELRTMTVEVVPGSGANQSGNVDFTSQQAAMEEEEAMLAELEERADHPEENTHEDEDTSQKDDTSENREDSEDREVDEERRDYWIWAEDDIKLLDRREVEGQKEAGDRQAEEFSKGLEEEEEVVERMVVGPLRRVVIVRHGKHIGQEGRPGESGGSQLGYSHLGAEAGGEDGTGQVVFTRDEARGVSSDLTGAMVEAEDVRMIDPWEMERRKEFWIAPNGTMFMFAGSHTAVAAEAFSKLNLTEDQENDLDQWTDDQFGLGGTVWSDQNAYYFMRDELHWIRGGQGPRPVTLSVSETFLNLKLPITTAQKKVVRDYYAAFPEDSEVINLSIVKDPGEDRSEFFTNDTREALARLGITRSMMKRHGKHIGQEGEEGRRGGSAAGFTHEEGSVDSDPAASGGKAGVTTDRREVKASEFQRAFEVNMKDDPRAPYVTAHSIEDLENMTTYLSGDGTVGFAIKDRGNGDIEATQAFNGGETRGVFLPMLKEAVAKDGVNYVEAFAPLHDYYALAGFVVDTESDWNPDFAPDNWDEGLLGTPKYYTMRINK